MDVVAGTGSVPGSAAAVVGVVVVVGVVGVVGEEGGPLAREKDNESSYLYVCVVVCRCALVIRSTTKNEVCLSNVKRVKND